MIARIEQGLVCERDRAATEADGRELGWDGYRVNVNGGAIAIGHPIGASGARVLTTLLHEMARRDVTKGLATLYIGGGTGIASCVDGNCL